MRALTDKQKKEQITKELHAATWGGYCGDSEFLQMAWSRFNDWCAGYVLEGIGSGTFHAALGTVLQMAMAWERYHGKRRELAAKYKVELIE